MDSVIVRLLQYINRCSRGIKHFPCQKSYGSSTCYSLLSRNVSGTERRQYHHQPFVAEEYREHLSLLKNSIKLKCHISAMHFSNMRNDSELNSLLSEAGADFKSDREKGCIKETPGDVNQMNENIDNNDRTEHVEAENTTEPDYVSSNRERVDIDAELLRYDYEEFDIIDEEDVESEYEEEVYPISLTRGSTGVYDIEDLVQLLRSENAKDVCVISVPPEIKLVDYMVIVTGRSPRHLHAMALYVKKLYKLRRDRRDPPTCHIEGDPSSKWLAMDLGNMILHLFTSDVREIYDLETLWTVGPKYDPMCREPKDLPDLSWVDGFTADFKQFETVSKGKPKESMDSLTGWHKT